MNKNIEANKEENKMMQQYEILTNTYNGRLSGLQNILTIQSVFTSAAILIIFSDLNGIDILTDLNYVYSHSDANAVLILSIISFVISLFSFISFIVQWNNCNFIRKKLLEYENSLGIDQINKKSGLRIPLLLSAIVLLISTVVFLAILVRTSLMLIIINTDICAVIHIL